MDKFLGCVYIGLLFMVLFHDEYFVDCEQMNSPMANRAHGTTKTKQPPQQNNNCATTTTTTTPQDTTHKYEIIIKIASALPTVCLFIFFTLYIGYKNHQEDLAKEAKPLSYEKKNRIKIRGKTDDIYDKMLANFREEHWRNKKLQSRWYDYSTVIAAVFISFCGSTRRKQTEISTKNEESELNETDNNDDVNVELIKST